MDTNTVAVQCPTSGCPHPLPLPPRPKVVAQVVLDHFQCYDVTSANNFAPRQVLIQDQFGTATVTLRRPQMICAPTVAMTLPSSSVGIYPDDLRNPIDQLVCYRIGESGGHNVEVSMDNQFGSQSLVVKNARLLCVPSIKTVP
jgi:hypothetical protein